MSVNISGLRSGTLYYLRAYATNASGTSYGEEISFTTSLVVGSTYGGGIIAYILTSLDAGYDANNPHGLIVSSANLNVGNTTTWGCAADVPSTSTAFGTGAANTAKIIAANCSTAVTAAKLCNDYTVTVNGVTYSDWYLPSSGDVQKIYPFAGQIAVGFPGYDVLATSTQVPTNNAEYYVVYFCCGYGGVTSPNNKAAINIYAGVRAVRTF
jgi:hypothetical protein